jgi:glycosyltransferase involved in cell wall biosynthesis
VFMKGSAKDAAVRAPARMGARRAKILENCTYPPPRAGWSMRVELIKKQLDADGHDCVVLNTGRNRRLPSPHYDTVMSPLDFVKKVWKYSRSGYTVHEHVNGESLKGFVRTLLSELLNLLTGKRCYLTFHAGVDQDFFPKEKAPALTPLYWIMFVIPKRIICNSAAVKTKITDYGVNPNKIVAIPAFTKQYLEFCRADLPAEVESFFLRIPHVLFTYVRIRKGFNLSTLIEGFAAVASTRDDVGLLLFGVTDDIDAILLSDLRQRVAAHGLTARVLMMDELDHDGFLTVLTKSTLYIRTPTTDGVAASVLEALALGVPVIAAENGTRPVGVITYKGDDHLDLASKVHNALDRRDDLVANLPRPEIEDTLSEELRILTDGEYVAI